MSSIWTPRGVLPTGAHAAMRAVEEYDAELRLGQQGPDWVVFKNNGPYGEPFPVFNFGRELPSADHVKQRLAECDVRRNARRIIERIERRKRAIEAEDRARLGDYSGEVAEAVEWALRKNGSTAHKKVVMNERVKK